MSKTNCYACKHRGDIAGDVHSTCRHPVFSAAHEDPLGSMLILTGGIFLRGVAETIGLQWNEFGVKNGWFSWPFNFDPTWLKFCPLFEAKEKEKDEQTA